MFVSLWGGTSDTSRLILLLGPRGYFRSEYCTGGESLAAPRRSLNGVLSHFAI